MKFSEITARNATRDRPAPAQARRPRLLSSTHGDRPGPVAFAGIKKEAAFAFTGTVPNGVFHLKLNSHEEEKALHERAHAQGVRHGTVA